MIFVMDSKLVILFILYSVSAVVARRPTDPPDWPWHPGVFEMYWNIPTDGCKYMGADRFRRGPWVMGFRQNTDDLFLGDEINLLYNPGLMPNVEYPPDEMINGGIPQAADLDEHLEMFEKHVKRDIKDEHFEGPAIISFHFWRPAWNLNGWLPRKIYRVLSHEYERKMFPKLTKQQAWVQASHHFETKARNLTIETLKRAIKLRPKALWGWHSYPVCFNTIRKYLNATECQKIARDGNERMKEILYASKALYSTSYLHQSVELADGTIVRIQQREIILNRVKELIRYNYHTNHTYLYVRIRYGDTGGFLTLDDMIDSLLIPCEQGIRGIILWDRSEDVVSPVKCGLLYTYMTTTLREAILAARSCSIRRIKELKP